MEVERLYTVREAAVELKVSEAGIYKWTSEGKLGCYRLGTGRNIRIGSSHLVAYLEAEKERDRCENETRN